MYSRDYVYARKYKVIVCVIYVYIVATADRNSLTVTFVWLLVHLH